MTQEKRLISPPDPTSPEFDEWVQEQLAIHGGTFSRDRATSKRAALVLDTLEDALRAYGLTKGLVPAVWVCIKEVRSASTLYRNGERAWAPGYGVRASVIQEAIWELERLRDSGAVPERVGAAAIGVRNALGCAVRVVGLRSEKLVPRDQEFARASKGGRAKKKKHSEPKWADWKAIGKDILKEEPRLSDGKELARRIRDHLKKTNVREYEVTFRKKPELTVTDPDSVRLYKQSLDARALNQIYVNAALPLLRAQKSKSGARRRRV